MGCCSFDRENERMETVRLSISFVMLCLLFGYRAVDCHENALRLSPLWAICYPHSVFYPPLSISHCQVISAAPGDTHPRPQTMSSMHPPTPMVVCGGDQLVSQFMPPSRRLGIIYTIPPSFVAESTSYYPPFRDGASDPVLRARKPDVWCSVNGVE